MVFPSADAISLLQNLPLFQDLAPRQLHQTAQLVTFDSKQENELIMRTASEGSVIYLILTGYVKICIPRHNGVDLILGIRGAGEVLGEMSIMDSQEKSATVITHTPCDLAWISSRDFWGAVWDFAPVPYNLTHLLNERIRRLSRTLNVLAPTQCEARLARQILLLANEFGEQLSHDSLVILPFSLSASDLAGLTAMPQIDVNACLRDWHGDGVIGLPTTPGSPFTIRNSPALQAMATAS